MGVALRSYDYYDIMEEQPLPLPKAIDKSISYFYITDNVDPSRQADQSDLDASVYSGDSAKDSVTIMSAFRKDLFVSVTLPLLALGVVAFGTIGASFSYTNSSFLRLDDHAKQTQVAVADLAKAQAVTTEQISTLVKGQQDANTKADSSNAKLDKISDQLGALNTSLEVLKAGRKQSPES